MMKINASIGKRNLKILDLKKILISEVDLSI